MPESKKRTIGMAVDACAKSGVAVTPSDSTPYDFKALWIGGTGNVVVLHEAGGTAVTYSNVPAGKFLEVTGIRVMAATTATDIVAVTW